jgi:hypothetical protein
VDVTTTPDAGLTSATDEEQLRFALAFTSLLAFPIF